MNKQKRITIAQETLDIMAAGKYINQQQQEVNISADLKYAVANTIHYKPEDFDTVFIQRNNLLEKAPATKCTFTVTSETTFAAARRLIVDEGHKDVCCLNFASAKNPGGGFLGGAQAQEEALARASGLYECLIQKREMYNINRAHGNLLYTDNMIYSPLVPVFRDDWDHLLDQHYNVSIITAPAANRGAIMHNQPDGLAQIESTMLGRTEKLLSVAVVNKQTTLILGAWGCGVFRNKTEDVAAWFAQHLLKNETFKHAFRQVVFAIYDPSEKKNSKLAFDKEFAGLSPVS